MTTHHTCPYAAALSDDENSTQNESAPHRSISPSQLSLARSKCPAFADNACPFRDAATNPEKLIEIMKTVPSSHFPSGSLGGVAEREEKKSASTPFQLAMEHIHNVSNWLGKKGSGTQKDAVNSSDANTEQFIIQGGCPFKSFHKNHSSSSTTNLARSMEEFSLAAIMGQLGASFSEIEEADENEHADELDRDQRVMSDEPSSPTKLGRENSIAQEIDIEGTHQSTSSQMSTLSQALKSGTAESHTAAENVHFVKNFIKGIIDRELYMELVTGLYHTYLTLEKLLNLHGPKHFPSLHFPEELSRTEALKEDMEFWHGINWESKPQCRIPSPAVKDYIDRMEEVGRVDPLLLLSHAYTRYLGDLSGGKVLSRIARRALHLDGYNGLQFYQFESIPSAKLFKDKYRSALDDLALKPDQIGRLVAEANVAFALNMRVFEELDVSGGVPGARVRDVREALVYYDREIENQKFKNDVISGNETDAQCPFGFVGGPNPHSAQSSGKKAEVMGKESESVARCPWPFIVFHDPATFMRDWQTWFVIGLLLCWGWSNFGGTSA